MANVQQKLGHAQVRGTREAHDELMNGINRFGALLTAANNRFDGRMDKGLIEALRAKREDLGFRASASLLASERADFGSLNEELRLLKVQLIRPLMRIEPAEAREMLRSPLEVRRDVFFRFKDQEAPDAKLTREIGDFKAELEGLIGKHAPGADVLNGPHPLCDVLRKCLALENSLLQTGDVEGVQGGLVQLRAQAKTVSEIEAFKREVWDLIGKFESELKVKVSNPGADELLAGTLCGVWLKCNKLLNGLREADMDAARRQLGLLQEETEAIRQGPFDQERFLKLLRS